MSYLEALHSLDIFSLEELVARVEDLSPRIQGEVVPMQPIQFGFPNEHMTAAGDYITVFYGFADVLIRSDAKLILYQFYHEDDITRTKVLKQECDNILQALAFIYDLLKTHGQEKFLPAEVKDV